MVFRACRPGGRGLVSRLIAACFTAVISTHFALRLLPVFPRARLWTALLFPDFQGAKPDLVFPFRRHWGSSAGDGGRPFQGGSLFSISAPR
jgi:hypothetical protein